ncbi:UrcA family protein [Sphingomonas psychrotolerans]|uniref:UrcA family protein n=1 Tax=Sphingomonas psychrotolerans TaxID=1327635 RepID=A0ABU3MY55_9SPHN|nr:UrcA family protein [Sphingomonas psychrotolerans]
MYRLKIAIAVGLLAGDAANPAVAQKSHALIVTEVSVPHGDLDLASEVDATAMLARLDKAATRACGGRPVVVTATDPLAAAKKREYERCKAAALDASIARLGAPRVRAARLDQQSRSTERRSSIAAGGTR